MIRESVPSFVERYRYKVVYPGGVHIRRSPAVDAEKTGSVLDYGDVFESVKSSVLDGVNFVKLLDGSGWVFRNLGETEILELLETVQIPIKPKHAALRSISESDFLPASPAKADEENLSSKSTSSSSSQRLGFDKVGSKSFQASRAHQKYWREMKAKVADCSSFEVFCCIANTCEMRIVDAKSERQCRLIKFIVSVTRQAVHEIDVSGLERCLWLFVNLGFKLSRTALALIIDSANAKFEKVPLESRPSLLGSLTELGDRTKAQRAELGKLVDILPDDIKNFHQRWLLIKVSEAYVMASTSSTKFSFTFVPLAAAVYDASDGLEDGSVATDPSNIDMSVDSSVSLSGCECAGDVEMSSDGGGNTFNPDNSADGATSLPLSIVRTPTNSNRTGSGKNIKATNTANSDSLSSSSTVSRAFSTDWLSTLLCKSTRSDASVDPKYTRPRTLLSVSSTVEEAADDVTTESVSLLTSMKNRLWAGIERQALKLSNPDVQFAGLI